MQKLSVSIPFTDTKSDVETSDIIEVMICLINSMTTFTNLLQVTTGQAFNY